MKNFRSGGYSAYTRRTYKKSKDKTIKKERLKNNYHPFVRRQRHPNKLTKRTTAIYREGGGVRVDKGALLSLEKIKK